MATLHLMRVGAMEVLDLEGVAQFDSLISIHSLSLCMDAFPNYI